MRRYFIKRAIITIFSLLGAIFLAFIVSRLAPGDPLTLMMGDREWDPALVQSWKIHYGLDKPILVQFVKYLQNIFQGDFGLSYQYPGTRVTEILVPASIVTLKWESISLAIALIAAVIIGTISVIKKNTWIDSLARLVVLTSISLPEFVFAEFLVLLFALKLHLVPVAGLSTPAHYILPAITMALYPCAMLTRLIRSSLLDILGQPYMLTARAKGLSELMVITRHGFRNAFGPVLTVVGILVGRILSGAFIIETIFNIPGLGRVMIAAIMQRDYPVILGVTVLLTTAFLLTSFLVDILYGILDPRIRIQET